jgi:hypothetical protein
MSNDSRGLLSDRSFGGETDRSSGGLLSARSEPSIADFPTSRNDIPPALRATATPIRSVGNEKTPAAAAAKSVTPEKWKSTKRRKKTKNGLGNESLQFLAKVIRRLRGLQHLNLSENRECFVDGLMRSTLQRFNVFRSLASSRSSAVQDSR